MGAFGHKSLEGGWLTDRQIEAARVAMTRFIKRGGKVWIRLFPDTPLTKKPAETRMVKGTGAPEQWVAVIRPGKVLFEMEGVRLRFSDDALRAVALRAIKRKTGARGLRASLESILLDLMYDLPSMQNVEEVIINVDVGDNAASPVIFPAGQKRETKKPH